jgi:hypothetical protein
LKAKYEFPSLAGLRDECGDFQPYSDPGKQIDNHWRKSYPNSTPKGRWYYVPAVFEPHDTRKPLPEISRLVDHRTLDQLRAQFMDVISQMLNRAHIGDDDALDSFVWLVNRQVDALSDLARCEFTRVQAKAATYPQWPVLLSLNPQDIQRVKQDLEKLNVGSMATIFTGPSQRVDPRNFWTQLATCGLRACRRAKVYTYFLKRHAKGAIRVCPQRRKYWGVETGVTYYYLSNYEAIIIADWHKQCLRLSEPITAVNFKDWWNAIKLCVLHHWQNNHGDTFSYSEALRYVGQTDKEEWQRRYFALSRIEQALRSLTKRRQQKTAST